MSTTMMGLMAVLAVFVLLYIGRRRSRLANEDHD
jgi:hypothetical protein